MPSDRFDVELTEAAVKDLRRLRASMERVIQALASLENDPHRGHPLTGNLVVDLRYSLLDPRIVPR